MEVTPAPSNTDSNRAANSRGCSVLPRWPPGNSTTHAAAPASYASHIQFAPTDGCELARPKTSMSLIRLPDGQEWAYSESLNRGHFNDDPTVFARACAPMMC
ncbi:hypothetical protein [Streptomyces sp. NBC_01353]|uniref:hypothetical protein n=1 Tax=Streptomyces sp. NBC_01353 TaxID=2903835 RepID=UPI003DA5E24D